MHFQINVHAGDGSESVGFTQKIISSTCNQITGFLHVQTSNLAVIQDLILRSLGSLSR